MGVLTTYSAQHPRRAAGHATFHGMRSKSPADWKRCRRSCVSSRRICSGPSPSTLVASRPHQLVDQRRDRGRERRRRRRPRPCGGRPLKENPSSAGCAPTSIVRACSAIAGARLASVGDEPEHERRREIAIRLHQPRGRLHRQRRRRRPSAAPARAARAARDANSSRHALHHRALPPARRGTPRRHLPHVEQQVVHAPSADDLHHAVERAAIRYGNSADGSLERSSGGHGSRAVVCECEHARELLVLRFVEADLAVLRLGRHHVERRADRDRLERHARRCGRR